MIFHCLILNQFTQLSYLINFILQNKQTPINQYYVRKLLIPYLITVYRALISRIGKEYLTALATKIYMGLSPLLSERIVSQINLNQDERIDQDEFVNFMLQASMGTKTKKLMIAFQTYDLDRNGQISLEEIKFISYNIQENFCHRHGISHQTNVDQDSNIQKHQLIHKREKEIFQID